MRAAQKKDTSVKLFHWINHHQACAKNSLLRLVKSPLAAFITIAMIAIAFIIPMVIYLLFSSADNVVKQSQENKQITLFLLPSSKLETAADLSKRLEQRADLYNVQLINKTAALATFKEQSGLGSIIDNLSNNPLPHIITANIDGQFDDAESLLTLKSELENLDEVDQVALDLLWIQKLESILDLFFKVLGIACMILSAAVGLIIANVIRWEVSSRASELEIMRLLGGTDAYVRRPFLYSGLWLGFLGALLAIFTLQVCSLLLASSFNNLQQLFTSTMQITSFSFSQIVLLLILGSLFGITGAWIAATRYLKSTT
jgi:cell division transport system permease protein